ncbi:hypothetical protein ACFUJU_13745 [Streptomyces sp. NPDC057235]|uniref:hypothetical protein n=1 Tax=Streptomyces sp. NPDC057235 TaxID=3346058 RepID=UPI00362D9AF5
MCIHIRFEQFDPLSAFKPYDAGTGTVTLPDALPHAETLVILRAVLEELAVVQPESGAICWCGEDILVVPRVPEQRRSGQVIHHGA